MEYSNNSYKNKRKIEDFFIYLGIPYLKTLWINSKTNS